jgi:hypothetical protein
VRQTLYKVLGDDGSAVHGGTGFWPLPDGERPGAWLELPDDVTIEPYGRGLHLCRSEDLVHWLGPAIFEAEYDGELLEVGELIARKARLLRRCEHWNERTARLFAADCAERSLQTLEQRGRACDPRSQAAIRAARLFADGLIGKDELVSAYAAAYTAAELNGEPGAYAATWCVGRSPFWAAARSAGYAGDWQWQTERLFEYLSGARN